MPNYNGPPPQPASLGLGPLLPWESWTYAAMVYFGLDINERIRDEVNQVGLEQFGILLVILIGRFRLYKILEYTYPISTW